jgi:hypothetical protein
MSQTPQVGISLSESVADVRLFSDSSCGSAISSARVGTAGTNSITTDSLTANASTMIFAQATDAAGNTSSCSSMTSYTHDNTPATVTSVSSTAANGSYRVGQTVPVTVTFTEPVFVVGGTPQITLETGAVDTVANYVSGSGTTTLTFDYVIALADGSIDLDYQSTSALTAAAATIKDLAGNNANLELAALGSGSSLAGQKAIQILTAPPVMTYTSISPATPGTSRTPTVTMSITEASTVTLYSNSDCSTAISAPTAVSAGAGQTVTTSTLPVNAATSIHARAVAAFANTSACTSMVVYTHDNVAPTVSSFVRATGQIASTNSLPVSFTLTFSEPIAASSFIVGDITNSGTAANVVWELTQVNSTTYTVAATAAGNGTIIPRLATGSVSDIAGNLNGSIQDASQTVNYAAATFTVSVDQAAGQADPINSLPLNFTVVFSTAVG